MTVVKVGKGGSRLLVLALGALTAVALAGTAGEEVTPSQTGRAILITLKNKFITTYKDRATIETSFQVDKVGKIHPPKKDGDLHVAGRSDDVGLPIVAEIMNAKFMKKAAADIKKAEGKAPIRVAGAWRIWCEHPGGRPQVQGNKLARFTDANPDHVFEIHPLTQVGEEDTRKSFVPIVGYTPKEAHAAFVHYENIHCKITPNTDTTTLRTSMAGYNIVKFIIEPLDAPAGHKVVDDGRFVYCAVRDLEDELIVRKVRMVFVKGTPPEEAVKELAKGKRLTVLGIPRIDLALVNWRVAHKDDKDKDEPLTWNLPYEMIVVAVFPDSE
jgi:hypothetical protein